MEQGRGPSDQPAGLAPVPRCRLSSPAHLVPSVLLQLRQRQQEKRARLSPSASAHWVGFSTGSSSSGSLPLLRPQGRLGTEGLLSAALRAGDRPCGARKPHRKVKRWPRSPGSVTHTPRRVIWASRCSRGTGKNPTSQDCW